TLFRSGQFLLRVEDTDKARSTDASTRAIFQGLEWLGLLWDEDVVFQGGSLARHQADAHRLLAAGKAYRCFCTPEELEARRTADAGSERVDTHTGGRWRYDRLCDRLSPE